MRGGSVRPVSDGVPTTEEEGCRAARLVLGGHSWDLTRQAVVMGILNRTPDSFFDKGAYWDFDRFLARADRLVAEGADILDVGGVRAGPGEEVTPEEELSRVVPAVEALRRRFDTPVSVDTWRAEVVQACFEAGAVLGNDISGFADPGYLPAAAAAGAGVVATHIRLGPRIPDPDPHYDDVVETVRRRLGELARKAVAAGIPAESVIVDAGLDLGKTAAHSLTLLRASDRLASLGHPLLLSASNKRFLWELLGVDVHSAQRGTNAAHALGVALGCRIVRAHDVKAARRVVDTVMAIITADEAADDESRSAGAATGGGRRSS
ncbi:MAG: dihydropteroate synthase [Acidimicrobiales bacterium]|nr:MAG: dihydropteroate synthase [Acidimicrobiales bacterium]